MTLKNHKRKIGLALSGGAARGLAHVGVLDVLHEAGIPIDLIAGTSAGAVAGAVYASGRAPRKMIEMALEAAAKNVTFYIDPALPRTGFLKGTKVRKMMLDFLGGDITFADLKIPFACVSTDINTGEEVVMDRGPLLDALRATISLPGIFTVARHEDRFLVDGGLTTPVPVHVVRQMGADFIIAVNVNPVVTERMGKAGKKRLKTHKEPTLFQILMQSFYITTYSLAHRSLSEADFIIEPSMPSIGAGDFSRTGEIITRGQEAARQALPEIKRKLEEII